MLDNRRRRDAKEYQNICYFERVAVQSLDDRKHMPGVRTVKYNDVSF